MEKKYYICGNESNRTVVFGQLFANLNQPWTTIIEHDFLYTGKEVLSIHAPCYLD